MALGTDFMKKEKRITKILGATLIITMSLTSVIGVYHEHVCTLDAPCPFNHVLGIEHQVNRINDEVSILGKKAQVMYVKDDVVVSDKQEEAFRYVVITDDDLTFSDGDSLNQDGVSYKIKL